MPLFIRTLRICVISASGKLAVHLMRSEMCLLSHLSTHLTRKWRYWEHILFYEQRMLQGEQFFLAVYDLYSIFLIFINSKCDITPPEAFLFFFFTTLWPALTCEPAAGCVDCLLPAVSAASKASLLLPWGRRSKNTRQERVGIWQMEVQKKKTSQNTPVLFMVTVVGGRGAQGPRRSSLLSHIHNHESRVVERLRRSLFIIRVQRIPADGRQVAGWCSRFKTLTPSDPPPQKVTSDMPCGGFTLGVKPASNSHLFGFIAAENLRRGRRGGDNMAVTTSPISHLWRAEVLWDGLNIDMLEFVKGLLSHGDEDMEQESLPVLL